jgi:hypothetical protein
MKKMMLVTSRLKVPHGRRKSQTLHLEKRENYLPYAGVVNVEIWTQRVW